MVFFYISLIVINLLLWLHKKKEPVILNLTLLALYILMSGNSEGPDIIGTIHVYSHPDEFTFNDPGYQLLQSLSYNVFNIDFVYFRYFLTSFCVLFIWRTIRFYNTGGHLMIALYMLYLFFMDTIQMRNFFAQVIVLYAFKYLLSERRTDHYKFIIYVLLASSMHVATLVYLLLIIPKFINKKKTLVLFGVLGAGIFVLSVLAKIAGSNFVRIVISMIITEGSRGEGYFESETNLSGLAISFTIVLGIFYCYYMKKRLSIYGESSRAFMLSDNLFTSNIIMLVFLSMLLININFYRYFRNFLLLIYLCAELYLDSYKENGRRRWGGLLSIILITSLWFIMDIIIINGFDECVVPIFEHNFLWE